MNMDKAITKPREAGRNGVLSVSIRISNIFIHDYADLQEDHCVSGVLLLGLELLWLMFLGSYLPLPTEKRPLL
jgi:hypothetical protein